MIFNKYINSDEPILSAPLQTKQKRTAAYNKQQSRVMIIYLGI